MPPPPLQKIPRTCQVGLKHGGVSKGGLNITLNPKKVPPKVQWMSQTHLEISCQTAQRRKFCPNTIAFLPPGFDKPSIIFHRIMEMPQNFQETCTTK